MTLVCKAYRLCVSLNSRLESNKEEEGGDSVMVQHEISRGFRRCMKHASYAADGEFL